MASGCRVQRDHNTHPLLPGGIPARGIAGSHTLPEGFQRPEIPFLPLGVLRGNGGPNQRFPGGMGHRLYRDWIMRGPNR